MKKFLILIIFSCFLNAGLLEEFKSLTSEQKSIIETIYTQCEPFDLQYTCVAIAWKESFFGKYKINFKTKDFGLMGINLHYHLKDIKLRKNKWNKSLIATKLIIDNFYNIQWAINNLIYWKKYHNGNWYNIWASYNGGVRGNMIYSKDIKKKN